MKLEPVARVRRHERPPAAVLLHAQRRQLRAGERALELVLVEREAEMVDARKRPLPRLHDDVHRAELELGQAKLEAELVQLGPRDSGLVRLQVLSDAPVARDEVEAELADVARLDLADAARDEVVVEQVHRQVMVRGLGCPATQQRLAAWKSRHFQAVLSTGLSVCMRHLNGRY